MKRKKKKSVSYDSDVKFAVFSIPGPVITDKRAIRMFMRLRARAEKIEAQRFTRLYKQFLKGFRSLDK